MISSTILLIENSPPKEIHYKYQTGTIGKDYGLPFNLNYFVSMENVDDSYEPWTQTLIVVSLSCN
jgi:hypothetical protein